MLYTSVRHPEFGGNGEAEKMALKKRRETTVPKKQKKDGGSFQILKRCTGIATRS